MPSPTSPSSPSPNAVGEVRLDLALVARGLARSRQHAQELIRGGVVTVEGVAALKPSLVISDDAVVEAPFDGYVGRAAHKLAGALEDSGTEVAGRVLDAGAATGGFTQVLLEAGATRVYAVDVGHDQLAPAIRADDRVVVYEGLNIRRSRSTTWRVPRSTSSSPTSRSSP